MMNDQIIICRYSPRIIDPPMVEIAGYPTVQELAMQVIEQARESLNSRDIRVRRNAGLFLSSNGDSLAADLEFNASRRRDGGEFISPGAFRHTLPSSMAAYISISLELRGPMVVYCGDGEGTASLAAAERWLKAGGIPLAVVAIPAAIQRQ